MKREPTIEELTEIHGAWVIEEAMKMLVEVFGTDAQAYAKEGNTCALQEYITIVESEQ